MLEVVFLVGSLAIHFISVIIQIRSELAVLICRLYSHLISCTTGQEGSRYDRSLEGEHHDKAVPTVEIPLIVTLYVVELSHEPVDLIRQRKRVLDDALNASLVCAQRYRFLGVTN